MKEILVSVIVPVYNSEKYLRKCVMSIVEQEYKKLEIILIDDGSIDNSGKICDEIAKNDERIKVIHQKNSGVSAARNAGMEIANGQYISFIDSDDYISKECYADLLYLMNKNYDLIKFQYYTETKKYKKKNINSILGELSLNKEQNDGLDLFFKYHELGSVWTTLFSKRVIENIKFNEKWKYGEDYCFYLEAVLNAKSMFISENTYYHYVVNEKSATHRKGKEKYLEQYKIHCEVDNFVYNKIISMGLYKYKIGLMECTYNMIINLAKQVAMNYSYGEYSKILNSICNSDSYKEYRKKDENYKKQEFKKIIEEKNYLIYLKFKIFGLIKKIAKIILK